MKQIIYKNATKIASAMFAILAGTGTEIFLGDGGDNFRWITTILIVFFILLLIPLSFIGDSFLAEYSISKKIDNDNPFDEACKMLNNSKDYEIIYFFSFRKKSFRLKPTCCMRILFLRLYPALIVLFILTFILCPYQENKEENSSTQNTERLYHIQDSLLKTIRQDVDFKFNNIINEINQYTKADSIRYDSIQISINKLIKQNKKIINQLNKK
jgi:preprotein translocase subunit SecG